MSLGSSWHAVDMTPELTQPLQNMTDHLQNRMVGVETVGTTLAIIADGTPSRRKSDRLIVDLLQSDLGTQFKQQGLILEFLTADEAIARAGRLRAALLLGETVSQVEPALKRLRRSQATALLPLLMAVREIEIKASSAVSWMAYADAAFDPSSDLPKEIAELLERMRQIEGRTAWMSPFDPCISDSDRRKLTILRMLVTRGIAELTPIRDPHAPFGHRYPPIDLLVPSLVADLDELVDAALLDRSFFERVHVCPTCSDARLIFREVCSSCHSADVKHGELVHHYGCGHVAPETYFERGLDLSCPSCSTLLRHIGVDYERPAELLYCNACERVAGEGSTDARCLACGASWNADALKSQVLYSYSLSAAGKTAAMHGSL